jgi:hypothetical protein
MKVLKLLEFQSHVPMAVVRIDAEVEWMGCFVLVES